MIKYFVFSILFISCSESEVKIKSANSNLTQIINLEGGTSCNYSGTLDIKSAYSFQSDADAENALKSIMKYTGLPTNFLLVAADVDNAVAVIYKNKRYILYNQRFMEEVKERTKSKYGALSILCHEIGHHLAGHTLLEEDSRSNLELEADRFSGFLLAKMGASIEEASVAMDIYGNNIASLTHPAKRTRLAAIANGWKEAMEERQNSIINPVNLPSTIGEAYFIDVVGEQKYISLRTRVLTTEEYKLANSGTPAGDKLNDETYIMNLPNGTEVEVLSSSSKAYYVKAKTPGGDFLGYVVKTFAGKPTIISKN